MLYLFWKWVKQVQQNNLSMKSCSMDLRDSPEKLLIGFPVLNLTTNEAEASTSLQEN